MESGDTATYQCIPGFESAGSKMIACQNGKWGNLPACSGKYSFELDLEFANYLCALSVENFSMNFL